MLARARRFPCRRASYTFLLWLASFPPPLFQMGFGEVTALIEAVPQIFFTSAFCKTAMLDDNLAAVFEFFGGPAAASKIFTSFSSSKPKMALTIQRQALLRAELMPLGDTLTWEKVVVFFKNANAEVVSDTTATVQPAQLGGDRHDVPGDLLRAVPGPAPRHAREDREDQLHLGTNACVWQRRVHPSRSPPFGDRGQDLRGGGPGGQ